MDLDNPAADVPGLGIPGDVIADFEGFSIAFSLKRNGANRFEHAALTAMAMQTVPEPLKATEPAFEAGGALESPSGGQTRF